MSKLTITALELPGAAVIDTSPFNDSRGTFARFFCKNELSGILGNREIVNVNFSRTSGIGTVRGMHYQRPPAAEMKLIRCISGAVYDVIIDIRRDSPTFLEWTGLELSAENMRMIVVPEGFAHGFQTLEKDSAIIYLTTEFYSPEYESALNADDPALAINWPLKITERSEKDQAHPYIDRADFKGVIHSQTGN